MYCGSYFKVAPSNPTAAQLRQLQPGDMLLIRPPPDKADQLGLHWGADPIYLPYDPSEPINAAAAMAAMEIALAVPGDKRRTTPMFTDGRGEPGLSRVGRNRAHYPTRACSLREVLHVLSVERVQLDQLADRGDDLRERVPGLRPQR